MGRRSKRAEDIAEELCFVCKDGGDLRVCDFKNCLKAYHPHCVGKEDNLLDFDDQFICELHKCVSCKRNSDYHCLCCPSSSVCSECLGKVEFTQLRNQSQSKGLCSNCLKLALCVEKNSEANTEDYLVLFKDYWEAIKDNEGLTLIDLQEANVCLRRSLICKQGRDTDKPPDEDYRAEKNSLGDEDNAEHPLLADGKVQQSDPIVSLKRKKSNKKTYVGWASEELIEFLSFIGKDTTKPLDQFELTGVVKEYIQQKNLFKDKKRKSVICDDKLHSLFRRKKVKSNMIHSLLEIHFAENAVSEDEYRDDFQDDEGPTVKKKPHNSLKAETFERDPNRNKNCFAALNQNNLKLIYLRKTLVMNLLGQDTFEQKIVGSLIRVKNDLKHYGYQLSKKPYQLGLVTGIKKSSQAYKIKDKQTDILLCVSNMWDDVKISMLSEEDIEEDECNDFLLSAKKEFFKRPTVADLEEKAANVHADIVNHQILSTQAERQRRLAEVPEAIPDTEEERKEEEFEVAEINHLQENKGATGHADLVKSCMVDLPGDASGQVADFLEVFKEKTSEDASRQVADFLEVAKEETPEGASERFDTTTCEVALEAPGKALCDGGTSGPGLQNQIHNAQDGGTAQAGGMGNGNGDTSRHLNGGVSHFVIDLDSDEEQDLHSEQPEPEHVACGATGATMDVVAAPIRGVLGAMIGADAPIRHCGRRVGNGTAAPIYPVPAQEGRMNGIAALHAIQDMNLPAENEPMWNYIDPHGQPRGPFAMRHMRQWHRNRFFPSDFRVWRLGQTMEDSILLTEAMGLNFSS
uniref:GYF domain-containing protein n=1 Tax=Leersia perrieri TaxID=77586 RepID=A0A0D9V8P0_9ORYZ